MKARLRATLVFWTTLFTFCVTTPFAEGANIVRVDVHKHRVVTGRPAVLSFLPVTAQAVGRRRLTPIADYGSHTVYEVTASDAERLVAELATEQYTADIATDIDDVVFQEYRLDADTGAVTPVPTGPPGLPAGRDGLFVVTLRSYPVEAWVEALERANVRIIQELEPAAYLVRAGRDTPSLLKLPFVRGIFPLRPAMKKAGFSPSSSAEPFRLMFVRSIEETPTEDLSGPLNAISNRPVTRRAERQRVTYTASLSEIDADVLTHFANVYSVGPLHDALPSSERQGVLAVRTPDAAGAMTLPPICLSPPCNPPNVSDYYYTLQSKGITDFANTKVGIIDTGFDTGSNSHSDFLNGSASTIEYCNNPPGTSNGICYDPTHGTGRDQYLHGTVVASIVGAFTDALQRPMSKDNQNYRYSLGLAPKVPLIIDRWYGCTTNGALVDSFARLRPYSPNVMTISINLVGDQPGDPGVGCRYGEYSHNVDSATRADKWLFTISTGNLPEGGSCPYVRVPATAKNAISVGATMGYAPSSLGWVNNTGANRANTCDWNWPPALLDGRHIPTYSVGWNPNGSLVKPDLVAPGTRITGPVSGATPRCATFGIFCNDALAFDPNAPPFGINYGFTAGTSFAAPAVAGAAAVVRKWHLSTAGSNPSPAMTKAMLINGALDLGPRTSPVVPAAKLLAEDTLTEVGTIANIPDSYQGWGMLNLARLLGPYHNYYFYDQRDALVTGGGVWQKYLVIRDGSKETRVTLVWTDAPSTTDAAIYKAVNNLNLSFVRVGNGVTWHGNKLTNGYSNTSGIKLDKINNVEQVILPANLFGTGEAVIAAVDPFSVMGNQDFALFVDNASEPATTLTTVPPCRAIDTRDPIGTYGGPALTANFTRVFPLANRCGIPATARAIAVNVTVTNPTASGGVKLFPAGTLPPTPAIVYYGTSQVRGNNALIALRPGGDLAIRPDQPSGSVHVILDVRGYYQ